MESYNLVGRAGGEGSVLDLGNGSQSVGEPICPENCPLRHNQEGRLERLLLELLTSRTSYLQSGQGVVRKPEQQATAAAPARPARWGVKPLHLHNGLLTPIAGDRTSVAP